MDSNQTGETGLVLDGQALTLVYDWRAISALRTALADDVLLVLQAADPMRLATILQIGLARHHPDWTEARIIEASPPIVPVSDLVVKAICRAFWGTEAPPPPPSPPPAP